MCNSLHHNSKPIPKEGFGWKVFYNKYAPLFAYNHHSEPFYRTNKQGWIVWEGNLDYKGFCFFTNRKAAIRVAYHLSSKGKGTLGFFVKKIEYREGLGKHREPRMLSINYKPTIALCRQFRILEEENYGNTLLNGISNTV